MPSSSNGFADGLLTHLGKYGYQARVSSVNHLPLLQQDVENNRLRLLDKEFYEERLSWFNYIVPESLPKVKSVVVVAVPRLQTQAIVTWKGQRIPLVIPPTYTAYDRTREQVENILAEKLKEGGYAWARTSLPLKLMATRTGLGKYGRNNLCYVSDMGSFLQLVAVYSDMPCEKDYWQEATMMESCAGCDLCCQACPTGAIRRDRFLLQQERCIVFHNEKKGSIPFPEWMKSSWHNCIIGCMHCQRVCPSNRKFLNLKGEEEEFSEEETTLLFRGRSRDTFPAATLEKLSNLSLDDELDKLPRNLGVLLH